MTIRLRHLTYALLCTALASCEVFDVHPYDGKIGGETQLNDRNTALIAERTRGKEEIRFAVISDTQRWYDEMEAAVRSINARGDIDFVLHCGDLSDFGITKEFEWQRSVMQKLDAPYAVLLGNHDCLGSGKEVFRTVFGRENFSFVAGGVRFICLDTNALEYDFSEPVPDLGYLKGFVGQDDVRASVVVMHIKPGDDEFNNNVNDAFHYYTRHLCNPLFAVCGHGHVTRTFEPFDDGFLYYEISCAKDRQYYVFTINDEGYDCQTIDY